MPRNIELDTHCPANKAAELIGDGWTLQILRSMMFGASRYGELQQAIPRISPAVLSGRLKAMTEKGLIVRREAAGGRGATYRLTASGRELRPVITYLAKWGLRWSSRNIKARDVDIGALMWDVHRSLKVRELPDGETVIAFTLTGVEQYDKWWMTAKGRRVGLWPDNPGKDVDVYLTCSLGDLVAIWQGRLGLREALSTERLVMVGRADLTRTIDNWFPVSPIASGQGGEGQGAPAPRILSH